MEYMLRTRRDDRTQENNTYMNMYTFGEVPRQQKGKTKTTGTKRENNNSECHYITVEQIKRQKKKSSIFNVLGRYLTLRSLSLAPNMSNFYAQNNFLLVSSSSVKFQLQVYMHEI
jgi:hypothetical protein